MRGFTLFIILFRRQILESYVPLVNEHPTNEKKMDHILYLLHLSGNVCLLETFIFGNQPFVTSVTDVTGSWHENL